MKFTDAVWDGTHFKIRRNVLTIQIFSYIEKRFLHNSFNSISPPRSDQKLVEIVNEEKECSPKCVYCIPYTGLKQKYECVALLSEILH